jgi:plastocyanin
MRRLLGVLACSVIAAAVPALPAVGATSSGVVVKAFGGEKYAINRYAQEDMRFKPGTIRVKSGELLTFEYGDREMEPHTLTIVPKALLPKTAAQIDQCSVCRRYATPHLKNPHAPPGEGNPIAHWVLNKGQAGLDEVGDSVAIQPGAHKKISIRVTAPAGTTLYFICAVHPWMQGRIQVT